MKLTIPSITIDPTTWGKTERATTNYALREIHDNLTLTDSRVEAWWRITPLAYDWKSGPQQAELIRQASLAWTGLRGRDFHLRVTHRPYPAAKWAMAYSAANPNPANPGHFRRHLLDVQQAMRGSTLAETEVYLGVVIAGRNVVNRLNAHVTKGTSVEKETAKLRETVAAISGSLDRPGLIAVPATAAELSWLMHRSTGLHLPEPLNLDHAPASIDEWDTSVFFDNVDVDPAPGHPWTTLTGLSPRNGDTVTRHVAVVSLGRTGELDIPERHDPWIAAAEKLPFPVEWSIRGRVLGGKDAAKHMTGRLKAIADQKEQFDAHHQPYTAELQRVDARATDLADEMQHAPDQRAARVHSYIRAAVSGRNADELRSNVRALQALYEDFEFEITWDGVGQTALAREFIPGEDVKVTSHKRHQPVDYFSAAIPHLSSALGDRDGIYLGYTVGTTRRAFTWHLHRAMLEEERAGCTPILGTLGSGKSTLLGTIGVEFAQAGGPTTIVDYKGALARLAYLDRWLPGQAQHIDALRAPRGTLSIYSSITDPTREQLLDDAKVDAAIARGASDDEVNAILDRLLTDGAKEAGLQRMQDAVSTLYQLLPHTSKHEKGVEAAIGRAVHHVGGSRTASLDEVVDWMVKQTGHDDRFLHDLGLELQRLSEYPETGLFFGQGDLKEVADQPLFVVLTAPGLVLPDTTDESAWTPKHRIAIPLRAAVLNYAARRMNSFRTNKPKLFISDEAHEDRRFPVGKAFYDRGIRQSRGLRQRWLIGTQKASDLAELQAEGHVSEQFTGRITDLADGSDALALAGLPTNVGYEQQVANLSLDSRAPYRDFLFTDSRGNTDTVRIDIRHDPDLLQALRVKRTGVDERERVILEKANA